MRYLIPLAMYCLAPLSAGAQNTDCARYTTHLCDHLDPAFDAAEQMLGLPKELYKAIAWTESRCKTRAKSRVGAMGVMQIMPSTWATLRVYTQAVDPWDPFDSIVTGALYFTQLTERYGGRDSATAWMYAAMAYNAGPGVIHTPPQPGQTNWDSFPTRTSGYATQVINAFLCMNGPSPKNL